MTLSDVLGRVFATDPGFVRLRLALRVTLTGLLILAALTLVHVALMPLAPAAFSAGLLFAIQGVVAIRDASPSQRLHTRLVSGAAGSSVLAVFSALSAMPRVVDTAGFSAGRGHDDGASGAGNLADQLLRFSGNKPLIDAILTEAGYPNGNGTLKDLVSYPNPAGVRPAKPGEGTA